MSLSSNDVIQTGKYTFRVLKTILKHDERIIAHTYKVGGDYSDCITISYKYSNNIPISVSMPHLLYEPECAIGSQLERGSGTELLIKSAMLYAYKDVPSLPIFTFDDMSHIDCVEKDLTKPPPRKPIKPLNLSYFSIAYHGMTWYEARFNAKMIDDAKYTAYKESLTFLTNPEKKLPFKQFLEIAQPSLDQIAILEPIYNTSDTYRQLFESIPERIRCDTMYMWLPSFMKHYIGTTFSEKGWKIDVNNMNERMPRRRRGGSRKKRVNRSRKVLYRIYNFQESHNF